MINFPQNPAAGQVYTFGAKTWKWNGRAWDLQSISDAQVQRAETAAANASASASAARDLVANVNLYFLAGEADHTGMFNRASTAARRVYVPKGSYTVSSASWPTDTEFFGDGMNSSVINMPSTATYAFVCNSGSADPTNNLRGLRMRNLKLRATVDVDGFSEHVHLVSINGVSGVYFEHVKFEGFRGDGVYVGSGDAGQERHNQNVVFRRCEFDGLNRDNRNAISFIDIDGALVEGCTFVNCSRPNMPGPIDFEPDPASTWAIIRNATIRRNKFANNGGGVGEVAVYVPGAIVAAPTNITVENNVSTGYLGAGQFFYFSDNRAPTATSTENDIKLLFNDVRNGRIPFGLFTGKRILVQGNTFMDMANDAKLGYNDGARVRDVAFADNRFVRCGATGGNGVSIFNADVVSFVRDKFIDCGSGVGGAANAIDFNTGSSSYISFQDVEFSAPAGKTLVAIQKEAGHNFNTSTNRYLRNNDSGLGNAFQADESDTLELSYAPTITGSGAAGAGVYTTQFGRYRRIGKMVYFKVMLVVSAGHTGNGMIQIGLPTTVAGTPNNEETLVNVALDGVASTGGQVGRINPALVVGGKGAIRCYSTGTGAMAQTAIPAGAFTVFASGSYQMP